VPIEPESRGSDSAAAEPVSLVAWRGDKPLVWWTEAASAKPGVDYVQQPRVEQAFPKGKNSMTFFVKLLPRATRSQPEVFYVAVADPAERGLDRVKHTAIRLPES